MATSKKQRKGAARNNRAINRPFAAEVLARAESLAGKYQIIVRFDEEELEYYGRCLELPNALGDGETPDACVASTREAIVALVGFMIERGERVPVPATSENRTEQINIRVTASEKLVLEEISGRRGFRGVSDFVRSAALSEAEG
jgi:predicted RNase H-like HicB family nuclease